MHIHRVWLRAESFVPSLSSSRTKMTGLCMTKTLVHISISSLFPPSAFLTFFFPSILYHPLFVMCILLIFISASYFFSAYYFLLHWRWHLCLLPARFSPQCRQFWLLSKTQPYTASFLLLRPSRPGEKRIFSCYYQKHLFPSSTALMRAGFLRFGLWVTGCDGLGWCLSPCPGASLPAPRQGRALPRARSAACCPLGAPPPSLPLQNSSEPPVAGARKSPGTSLSLRFLPLLFICLQLANVFWHFYEGLMGR